MGMHASLPCATGALAESTLSVREPFPAKHDCAEQNGFSLLEVLVAFAVMALSLGLFIHIFTRAGHTTELSASYSRAVALAEARLNAVGIDIPLEIGTYSGEPQSGLSWQILIESYEPNDEIAQEFPLDLLLITSVVSWSTSAEKSRELRLSSLRIHESDRLPGIAGDEQSKPPARSRGLEP
jgi:general secretion pathway protein I